MKYKKIMLVTLLLLAVLTIGAVSANDDFASDDNLTVSDDGDSIQSSVDGSDLLSDDGDIDDDGDEDDDEGDDDEEENPYEVEVNEEFDITDEDSEIVTIPYNENFTDQTICVEIYNDDENLISNASLEISDDDYDEDDDICFYVGDFAGLTEPGDYYVYVYLNDDIIYEMSTEAIDGSQVRVVDYEDAVSIYSTLSVFSVYCPEESSGKVNVTVRKEDDDEIFSTSEKDVEDADDEGMLYWTLDDLNIDSIGTFNIVVTYDDEELDDFELDVDSPIWISEESYIGADDEDRGALVTLLLPSDVEMAEIVLYIGGEDVMTIGLEQFVEYNGTTDEPYWYYSTDSDELDYDQKAYVILNKHVDFGFIEDTYDLTVNVTVEGNSIIDSAQVKLIPINVVENDNVTIKIFEDEYDIYDEESHVVEITANESCEGTFIISVGDVELISGPLDDFDEDGDGIYYVAPYRFNDLGKGEFNITVAYWDNDELILNTSGIVSFYDEEDDEDDEYTPVSVSDINLDEPDEPFVEICVPTTDLMFYIAIFDDGLVQVLYKENLTDNPRVEIEDDMYRLRISCNDWNEYISDDDYLMADNLTDLIDKGVINNKDTLLFILGSETYRYVITTETEDDTILFDPFYPAEAEYYNLDIVMYDDESWYDEAIIGIIVKDIIDPITLESSTFDPYVVIELNGENVFEDTLVDPDNYTDEGDRVFYITIGDLDFDDWEAGEEYEVYVRIYDGEDLIWTNEEEEPYLILYEPQIASDENTTIEVIPTPNELNDEDVFLVIDTNITSGDVFVFIGDSETPITIPLSSCRQDSQGRYVLGSKELGLKAAGVYNIKVTYNGLSREGYISLTSNLEIELRSDVDDIIYTGEFSDDSEIVTFRSDDIKDVNGTVKVYIYLDGENPTLCFEGDLKDIEFNDNLHGKIIRVSHLENIDSDLNGTYLVHVAYEGGSEVATNATGYVTFKILDADDFEAEITKDSVKLSEIPVSGVIEVISDGVSNIYDIDDYNYYDDDGNFVIPLDDGVHQVTVNYKPDEDSNSTLPLASKLVNPFDPALTISVANITEGADAIINVTTNTTFSGNVTVKIGDENYTVAVTDGIGSIPVSGLSVGDYTAVAVFEATEVFNASEASANFTVSAKPALIDPALTISVANITEGADAIIDVTTNTTFSGNVTVTIGVENYTVAVTDGVGSIPVSGLTVGDYTAVAVFEATEVFNASEASANFTVSAKPLIDPALTISVANIIEGEVAVIEVTTNTTFSGNVTVRMGDKNYTVGVTDGNGSIPVSGLSVGDYTAVAVFEATDVFNASEASANFTVSAKPLIDPALTISVASITEGEVAVIEVTTNTTFSGNVTVTIGANNYTVAVTNGAGSLPILGLSVGDYTAVAIFEATDVFKASQASANFTVSAKPALIDPALTISVADITEGADAIVTITTNATFSGQVSVQVGNNNYTVNVTNGTGSTTLSGLTAGTYNAIATFKATDVFSQSTKNDTFTVSAKAKTATVILVSDLTTTYGTSKKIVVKLTDANGNALAGKSLTITFNGVKTPVTTDSRGQASISISKKLAVKKYPVSVTFDGDADYAKATNSANVIVKKAKSKLTAKKSKTIKKSKKSKKSKKYTVTLKTDKKKALKKAKITLKLTSKKKKKTLKAKTNKKGKATFDLSKLAKGKYKAVLKYKGNKYYKGATKKGIKITVKK